MTTTNQPIIHPLMKPGQVVVMSISQLHAFMLHHHLEPLAWRGPVLVLQKIVERPVPAVDEENESA